MAKYKSIPLTIDAVQVNPTIYSSRDKVPKSLLDVDIDGAFSELPRWLLLAMARQRVQPVLAEDGVTVNWRITEAGLIAVSGDWLAFMGGQQVYLIGNTDIFLSRYVLADKDPPAGSVSLQSIVDGDLSPSKV